MISEEPVIELEEDDSVQSRFAALREEISDGESEDRGSVEDRMKKFLESDKISTTPFYTLDAIDDEIFALIIKSENDEDWKKILQNNSIKNRLTSQGIIALERNEINWDDATLLFTLGLKLDNNNIPIKTRGFENREIWKISKF